MLPISLQEGAGGVRKTEKGHLEQAGVKTYIELLKDSIRAARKFPTCPGQTGAKVKLQSWAHPHRAEHLRRAASQQQSWFGGYSQPHPWSCRRVLRLMALSPSHTLSRRAGGVPTNPAVHTGPQHPQCTDTTECLKAQTCGTLRALGKRG